ncbi:hypothetical protein GOP47_0027903 [Adiantum capillus-veneris]|nr:hypothetical protein GOP47_0027903 [Adiantum capillus-veneris]
MGCLLLDFVHIRQTTIFSFTDLLDSMHIRSKNQFIRALRNCTKGFEGLPLVILIEGLLARLIMAALLLWHGSKVHLRFLYVATELLSCCHTLPRRNRGRLQFFQEGVCHIIGDIAGPRTHTLCRCGSSL